MAKIKTGGTTGRKRYHLTNRSSRSVGESLIETGFGALTGAVLKGTFSAVTGIGRSRWGKKVDNLKNNAKTVATGNKYDKKGNIHPDSQNYGRMRSNFNRAAAGLSIPFNVLGLAVQAPFSAAAAVTKGAVTVPLKTAGDVAKKSARPMARLVGGTVYETARVGGQVINGGIKTLRAPGVMDLAMAGTFVGGTAIGLGLAINEIGGGNRDFNGHASGLAGTTGMAPTPLVNTGANGDLVLAMHKLR